MVRLFVLLIPLMLFAATYEIAEPDMLSEIEGRKEMVVKNLESQVKREKSKIEKLSGEKLTKATKDYTYYVDPTYTLTQDIPRVNNSGKIIGVLYPKGYTFNPLDYITMTPPPIVVFNACDKKEIEVVKKIIGNDPNYILASSGCAIKDFPRDIGRRIYLVTEEMKKKFDLKYTVSIVSVDLKTKRIKIEVLKTAD